MIATPIEVDMNTCKCHHASSHDEAEDLYKTECIECIPLEQIHYQINSSSCHTQPSSTVACPFASGAGKSDQKNRRPDLQSVSMLP